jgi:hypothetical protein
MRRRTWKVREKKGKKNKFESMLLLLLLLTGLVFEFDVVVALKLQWQC